MIKENQRLLNQLNVLSDGAIIFCALMAAFFTRFVLIGTDYVYLPLGNYAIMGLAMVPIQLTTYAVLGLYGSFRNKRLHQELIPLLWANALTVGLLLVVLFLGKFVDFSRLTLALFFLIETVGLSCKRYLLRRVLRRYRQRGYNQKHVLLVGGGATAQRYWHATMQDRELGYLVTGYASDHGHWRDALHLGPVSKLDALLEQYSPDEVVVALEVEEYRQLTAIIAACEKTGAKVSIIPFYADYLPAQPQFDSLNGLPMINLRRIPLDNFGNATLKRCVDVVGALVLIVLTSPIMLCAAVGVKLSSPGPVIFRQKRVGRNKKPFYMYKFRSMRLNDGADTQWSRDQDPRKTAFGAFIRKCSIDELPQFFNVLKGDMSLVGPRPEIPFYVAQFKEDIPLYMVKHQVRPGITGWAQVCGLRGDTSIEERIRHDIFYIENWTLVLDLKILCLTLFKGVVNRETLK